MVSIRFSARSIGSMKIGACAQVTVDSVTAGGIFFSGDLPPSRCKTFRVACVLHTIGNAIPTGRSGGTGC